MVLNKNVATTSKGDHFLKAKHYIYSIRPLMKVFKVKNKHWGGKYQTISWYFLFHIRRNTSSNCPMSFLPHWEEFINHPFDILSSTLGTKVLSGDLLFFPFFWKFSSTFWKWNHPMLSFSLRRKTLGTCLIFFLSHWGQKYETIVQFFFIFIYSIFGFFFQSSWKTIDWLLNAFPPIFGRINIGQSFGVFLIFFQGFIFKFI